MFSFIPHPSSLFPHISSLTEAARKRRPPSLMIRKRIIGYR
jgi:hypothetical protein